MRKGTKVEKRRTRVGDTGTWVRCRGCLVTFQGYRPGATCPECGAKLCAPGMTMRS
jgi:rRNA maturation endonuclease Nob1